MLDFLVIEPDTVFMPAEIDEYLTRVIDKHLLHFSVTDRAFPFFLRCVRIRSIEKAVEKVLVVFDIGGFQQQLQFPGVEPHSLAGSAVVEFYIAVLHDDHVRATCRTNHYRRLLRILNK
jgi:hypothetical protein